MDFQKELIAEFDRETASTRKLLEAIPADVDFAYKPHPKSMPLGRLVGHIAETGGNWASMILTQDKLEFGADHKWDPYAPTSKVAFLEKFDLEIAQAKADLAAYTPEKWDGNWKLIVGENTYVDDTKYNVWRTWVVNHMIHHRAQLSVYLRLLDHKIPGMYGPSADDV